MGAKEEIEALIVRIQSLHPDEAVPQVDLIAFLKIVGRMARSLEKAERFVDDFGKRRY